jgi:hypothetical protein
MSGTRITHGVVSLAALDLRRRPAHPSEMRSQLLMGEVVRVRHRDGAGAWCLVQNESDGYEGWVRAWGLVEVPARRAANWRSMATARVSRLWAEVRVAPGRGPLVSPLVWGNRVIPGTARGLHRNVELPDGRRGWVDSRALDDEPVGLQTRVLNLLGVPYLWGGRTPAGIDCSAFVQLVLAEQGVCLPRDAADQELATVPLDRGEPPEPGDLVFFGPSRSRAAHVGIVLGGGYYAHSRGLVRINSFESGNQLYDKKLSMQLRAVRRPRRGTPSGQGPS